MKLFNFVLSARRYNLGGVRRLVGGLAVSLPSNCYGIMFRTSPTEGFVVLITFMKAVYKIRLRKSND